MQKPHATINSSDSQARMASDFKRPSNTISK